MNKFDIKGLNETIIHEKVNGLLDVYLLPNKNVKNFYMTFNTKFGSLYTEFKTNNGKFIKVPNGVAHFLEHLTFKLEDGKDASDMFADLGSSSNAFTSFRQTCYEVFAYDKFKENLNLLLDYVQTPCYTKEVVEAEKGIICEEVKMYQDDPNTKLIFKLYENLFVNDNHKYLVAGTVKDVKSTTLKDIENAYNTFYHPSNMFVVITGNFNPEEALAIITENQEKKKFMEAPEIKIKHITEPQKIVKEYEEIETNVEIEKVSMGIKIPKSKFNSLKLSDLELNIYLNIIIKSKFGRSSLLRERLISGNIITDGIVCEKFITDDYVIIDIMAETPYPKRFISIIKEEFSNFDIDESDLNRKKKVALSNLILSFDDIEGTNCNIQSDIIVYNKLIIDNIFDVYEKININVAKKICSNITSKYMATVVLKPKK